MAETAPAPRRSENPLAGGALDHSAGHELRPGFATRLKDSRQARPRHHLGLCPQPRLSRRDQGQAQGARGFFSWRRAGGDVKVFVDTAPVMEKPLAEGRRSRAGRASIRCWSRANFGSWLFSGCDLHDRRAASGCARERPLWLLPAAASISARPTPFPRPISSMRGRCHLLSDHRAQGPYRSRPAPGYRQPHLRL